MPDPSVRVEVVGEPAQPARLIGQPNNAEVQRFAVERAPQHQACRRAGDRIPRPPPPMRRRTPRAARRRRWPPAGWPSRWWPAPECRPAGPRAGFGSGGSRAGNRVPSRRCSAPRRSPPARPWPPPAGSTSSRKPGLFSRSGDTSSTSTAPARTCVVDLAPLFGVRRIDRHRADAGPLGGGDLVAHQRQQRRDDHRRAGALLAQQRGGDEVDGRLAPAGSLHHQGPPPLLRPGRGSPSTGRPAASRTPSRPTPAGGVRRARSGSSSARNGLFSIVAAIAVMPRGDCPTARPGSDIPSAACRCSADSRRSRFPRASSVASASRCGVQKCRNRSNQASVSCSGAVSTEYSRRVPSALTWANPFSRRTFKCCDTAGWVIANSAPDHLRDRPGGRSPPRPAVPGSGVEPGHRGHRRRARSQSTARTYISL